MQDIRKRDLIQPLVSLYYMLFVFLLYRWGFKYQVMSYEIKGLCERPIAQYIQPN